MGEWPWQLDPPLFVVVLQRCVTILIFLHFPNDRKANQVKFLETKAASVRHQSAFFIPQLRPSLEQVLPPTVYFFRVFPPINRSVKLVARGPEPARLRVRAGQWDGY